GPDGMTDTQSITVMGGEKAIARAKTTGTAPATVPLPPPPPAPEGAAPLAVPPLPPPANPIPEETSATTRAPATSEAAAPGAGRKGAFDPPRNVVPVIVLGALAVAGYAGAVVALVFKQQAQDKADQVAGPINMHGGCPSTTIAPYCDAYATDTSNVNDDATFGNIALGIGVAGTVGAVVYWLVANKGDDARASTQPIVAPIVGPNVGGLSLSGAF
ncbi:MAG TPA: hypothetical protein VN894_00060, partial [Polyangiaceae bacterium]|nr:hypothetical protein [Polyangiaceae bacterium]